MKNFKKAFTLIELMVILFVISVVVMVTLLVQKPFDKGTALLYNRAFTSLSTAIYNIHEDLTGTDTLMSLITIVFCEKLAKVDTGYMNTSSATNCNPNTVPLTAADTDFSSTTLQFVTSNGMKFYLSPVDSITVTGESGPETIPYRIVFVDLNGDTGPNTMQWSSTKMADIVAFLVTIDGDVIPVGYPEIDRRYLTAKVHYPDGDTEAEVDQYSDSMSYFDAKATAWGVEDSNYNLEEIMSIKFNDDFPAGAEGKLKVKNTDYSVTYPDVNTTMGCVAASVSNASACEVEFNQYLN